VWLFAKLMAFSASIFTVKVRGLGVPIAITVLLALAPIILLYQQNQLVGLQQQITQRQTALMRLQTVADTNSLSREVYKDVRGIAYLIARLNAAKDLYKQMRDQMGENSVRVRGRTNPPNPLSFDETADVKDFFMDLCGTQFSARLRPASPEGGTSQCRATNPYSLLQKIRTPDFENDPYGKTMLAWLYYMKKFGDSEHYRLLGAAGLNATGNLKEDFVSDIIQQASDLCFIEDQEASRTSRALNLAANIRAIEVSAQQFISLFQAGFAAIGEDAEGGSRELRDAISQFKTATMNLLTQADTPGVQQEQLSAIEKVVANSMIELSGSLDCQRQSDIRQKPPV
jgi:hypothetical protein